MTKVYEQLDPRIRAASLFANLYSKINSSLNTNNSNFLLNTDLLRKEIKQEWLTKARIPYVLDLEHRNPYRFFYYKVVKRHFSESEGSMFF